MNAVMPLFLQIEAAGGHGFAGLHMQELQHETVHFYGRVQGVGFRYTTLQIAREFEVAGYVKNLPDGPVLLEIEGLAPEISAFIKAIEERMHGYIRRTERSSARRTGQFQGFEIR